MINFGPINGKYPILNLNDDFFVFPNLELEVTGNYSFSATFFYPPERKREKPIQSKMEKALQRKMNSRKI